MDGLDANPHSSYASSKPTVIDLLGGFVFEIFEAAIIWAYCPDSGGYYQGPSIESVCEFLADSVLKYINVDSECIPSVNEWQTLKEVQDFLEQETGKILFEFIRAEDEEE